MPKLNPSKNKKSSLKINVSQSILDEVSGYVEHFGLVDASDFFEQAAEFVLSSDKDWKKAKKNSQKNETISE